MLSRQNKLALGCGYQCRTASGYRMICRWSYFCGICRDLGVNNLWVMILREVEAYIRLIKEVYMYSLVPVTAKPINSNAIWRRRCAFEEVAWLVRSMSAVDYNGILTARASNIRPFSALDGLQRISAYINPTFKMSVRLFLQDQ